jgi:ABC-type branched-subunit amino acid transport system substrate-binding protein
VIHRRHPSPFELGAYFDGEPVEGVADHLAHCRKCRESIEELRGVRSAVRGELDLTDGSARRRARWTVALIPVAAAVALLVAVAAPPGGLPVTRVENADEAALAPAAAPEFTPAEIASSAATPPTPAGVHADRTGAGAGAVPAAGRNAPSGSVSAGPSGADTPAAADPGRSVTSGAGQSVTKTGGRDAAGAGQPAPARSVAAPLTGPLRIGVPVPTRGASSAEGDQVLRAVRAVVDRANGTGGVAGRHVELVTVPTDDDAGRADALGRVDTLVGGFSIDAPAGMPWIMPADVGPSGPDVAAAELGAEQAGAALGLDLSTRRNETGTVGAIVAPGPDAGLATGLAKSVAVQQVEAGTDTSCDQEVLALRRRDVRAVALAVPPDLARRCAAAAARLGWRPGTGLLLAPSAVYAHLERDLVAQGAKSAVALLPPASDDPGAQRFRQAVPGTDSYRALVSFAAAELALDAGRLNHGAVTVAAVRDHHWHSDLYDVDGGQQTTAHVVAIRFGRWAATGATRHPSSPPMRRGVVIPPGGLVAWAGLEPGSRLAT